MQNPELPRASECGTYSSLAIDAGGSYFKSVIVKSDGSIVAESFCQRPVISSGSKDNIIGAYREIISAGLSCAKTHGLEIKGLGISTPGPFDYERGVSLMKHKFQAIINIPLRDEIYMLKLLEENIPISFIQDVHAFLLGENWTGVLKGCSDAIAVTLGTGLGFGVMKNSKIMDNGHGGPFMVIYNRPYGNGIIEDRISRRGIIREYCRTANPADKGIDVHEIALKARENADPHAIRVFAETGRILAGELEKIIRELQITNIVFGGQISKSFDLFGQSFIQTLSEMKCRANAFPGKNIS